MRTAKGQGRTIQSLTLVVPCFNEEEVLPEFHRRASSLRDRLVMRGVSTDMIFVDDSSRDRTWEILGRLSESDPCVRAIRLARNRGHQIAVTAGLDFADGDVVVILDADLQDPPEVIEEMLDLVERGFDVVHAQRRKREGETTFKLATARLFYWFLRRVSRVQIVENAGDFRAVARPVVIAAREFREPHRFMRGTFAAIGFRQTVMMYDRDERFAGTTKYPFRRMLKLAIDATLGFSSAPIRAIVWCSIALWSLSVVYLGVSLYSKYVLQNTTPGWTSVVFLMTFFTGLILMSIAVVGAYIGRIFEQGQGHPLYWLERAKNIGRGAESGGSPAPREVRLSRAILELGDQSSGALTDSWPLVEPKPAVGVHVPAEAESRP